MVLMGIFDEAFDKAKDTFEVIGDKTNEVISVGKLKMKARSLSLKLAADYEQLGRLHYSVLDGAEIDETAEAELKTAISEKETEIADLKKEIAKQQNGKVCAKCGKINCSDAAYCNGCGEMLK